MEIFYVSNQRLTSEIIVQEVIWGEMKFIAFWDFCPENFEKVIEKSKEAMAEREGDWEVSKVSLSRTWNG